MKVPCFIYLSEGDGLQKEGNVTATNVASQLVERGHARTVLSCVPSVSFIIYVRLPVFLFFHKVFEVVDDIETHGS